MLTGLSFLLYYQQSDVAGIKPEKITDAQSRALGYSARENNRPRSKAARYSAEAEYAS